MARKPLFPPEPITRPDGRGAKRPTTHRSGPAPKDMRERAEAPTMPPPATKPSRAGSQRSKRTEPKGRDSGVRGIENATPAAMIDEVTADLSRDPRREQEDDDDENGSR